jgi:hypothetical protein
MFSFSRRAECPISDDFSSRAGTLLPPSRLSLHSLEACAMPKFFFNIVDDACLIEDHEGMELPDLEAARNEARESARELLADALRAHKDVDGRRIEIANARGDVIAALNVRDLLN